MRAKSMKRRGNCYVSVESLWYLLGGRHSPWKPAWVRHEGDVHWFLVKNKFLSSDYFRVLGRAVEPGSEAWWREFARYEIIDPTRKQFKTRPRYHLGVQCGFLTKKASKRAKALMEKIVWQDPRALGKCRMGKR